MRAAIFKYPFAVLITVALLAACGPASQPAQPTSPPATGAPAATAMAEPTAAPTATPATAAPTAEPSATPAPPTAAPVNALLATDMPWVYYAGTIYGDDESFELQAYGHPEPAYGMRASPNGAYVAYVAQGGRLALIDMRTGASALAGEVLTGDVAGFVFAPDSSALAATTIDASAWRLSVLDLASGKVRALLEGALGEQSGGPALVASPAGWTTDGLFAEQLMWGSDAPPQDVLLIDPANANTRTLHKGAHLAIYPAPSGGRVALVTGTRPIGDQPTTGVSLLSAAGGPAQQLAPEAPATLRGLHWSPDSSRLLVATTASYDAPATTLRLLPAAGGPDFELTLGGPDVRAVYTDLGWRDSARLLLLSAEAGRYVKLYSLPADQLGDAAALSPIMGIEKRGDERATGQLVFLPR